MYKHLLSILAAVLLFSPLCAFADHAQFAEEDIPEILQPEHRTKQPLQFEIMPYGGSYLGNTIGQTWTAGAKAYFHVDNTFAFGFNGGYAELLTDRSSSFGRSVTYDNVYIMNAEAMISNDLAMRVGRSLYEVDLYLTLGMGAISMNEEMYPMGVIGGGIKLYTPVPWLAIRIDMNNYAHFTDTPGKDNFDFDVTFIGGPSFMFPSHKIKKAR